MLFGSYDGIEDRSTEMIKNDIKYIVHNSEFFPEKTL